MYFVIIDIAVIQIFGEKWWELSLEMRSVLNFLLFQLPPRHYDFEWKFHCRKLSWLTCDPRGTKRVNPVLIYAFICFE